ncbi:MAG: putative bifunctional diguanylate cyclase/phosphodiesterase [Gammaproteobacteria bacterium]
MMPGPQDSAPSISADAYEALMQFLYRAPIGLVQTDGAGAVEMLNPMSANLLMPLSPDGTLDNLFDVLDGVAPGLRALCAETHVDGVICENLRFVLPPALPGAESQVLSLSLLRLDAQRLMAVLTDVTQEVEREQATLARRVRDATHTDGLTRMPNRLAILEQLARLLELRAQDAGREFAVLFLNCDRFKQVNDAFGPGAGDAVLSMIGERLRAALRQGDSVGRGEGEASMAGRIGGDEFVVLVENLRRGSDVHAITNRLIGALAPEYDVDGHAVRCGVSMGVVLGSAARTEADGVLADASIATEEAKRAGGMRAVLFEPAMRERAARRGGLEAELRRALAEGQFFVVYQPVIALAEQGSDHALAGVEALVRWQHPERGLVPPLEFIEVAESCGLIGELGFQVLEAACRQFLRWREQFGPRAPRRLAVNLSRAQLAETDFVPRVAALLAALGMAPPDLQFEVTESLAAQDSSVQAVLKALKALGLTLALDDFGTGYSSLASLHLLPVDTVKIDRSFVCHADHSQHHRVLIDATVRVAASLGMDTVAEGIETVAQAAVVRELGCDKGQGYLFSKPLRGAELVEWLNEERGLREGSAVAA